MRFCLGCVLWNRFGKGTHVVPWLKEPGIDMCLIIELALSMISVLRALQKQLLPSGLCPP